MPNTGDRRARLAVLLLGALAVVSALAFPFAPVRTDQVSYRWPAAQSDLPAALPLMPYQPASLTATIPCSAAGTVGDGGVLLSTVPLRADPAAPALAGLRVEVRGGEVEVRSGDRLVASRAVPSTGCDLVVRSTPESTMLLVGGEPAGSIDGDVRPAVAGLFTEADTGDVRVEVVAETPFESTITPLKAALAIVCVLALLGALSALWTLDRRHGRRVRRLGQAWWRPRLVDVVVVGALALWALIGPVTVDDGYIGGMLRSRDANGFVGNVYRWLNAPEAPFGWFYELSYLWGQISWSAAWLRLPSTLVGVGCWLLLSRLLLPRLGRFGRFGLFGSWTGAAVFLAWWLPFNTGLRSEPWVAIGLLAVFCAVERAVAARTVLPIAVGLVIAVATLATSPTGIVAFAPFVAALPALLRVLRARADIGVPALLAVLAAAPAAGLLLMFADQSFAAVDAATAIRQDAPGSVHWYQEYLRYANLLTPGSIEGPLPRRVPVLFTLAALAGVAWLAWAGRPRLAASGISAGPTVRLALVVALSLGLFILTPTKWTYHFGVLAGVGAGLLVVGLRAFGAVGLTVAAGGRPVTRLRLHAIGLLAVAVLGGFALAGYNQWPFVSNFGLTWGTVAPLVLGRPVAGPFVVAGVLVAAALLAQAAWLVSRPAGAGETTPGWPRWVPSPAAVALVLLLCSVLLQIGTFAKVSVERTGTYTMAGDTARAVRGTSCGLADYLGAELDPAGGELSPVPASEPATLDGFEPAGRDRLEVAGQALTGWQATGHTNANGTGPATASTPWYRLTDEQRRGELPLVVTVGGPPLAGSVGVVAELAGDTGDATVSVPLGEPGGAPDEREVRLLIPPVAPDADRVRLVAADGGPAGTPLLAFSVPRSPHLTALTDVLPAGTTALLDWPVAFHYPCLRMPALAGGVAEVPRWRISTPCWDDAPAITYAPPTGGPFATARMLVTEQRIPLYLRRDPTADVGRLYRWVPVSAAVTPDAERSPRTVPGWRQPAPMSIPASAPRR